VIPLVNQGRVAGVLEIARTTDSLFTPEDVDFLKDASGQIAIAIENCLAYREVSELKESYFVEKFAKQMQKKIDSIPAAVMKALKTWEWPGNIRELENLVERAVILTRGRSLEAPLSELRKVKVDDFQRAPADQDNIARIVKETIKALYANSTAADHDSKTQRDAIVRILTEMKGRVGGSDGVAARMGINRTTLLARMKKLGIDPRDYV
jgi:formate hydrogenlyase transcriptional activator